MNPLTFIEHSGIKQSEHGLAGKMWAKLRPMLWKKRETGIMPVVSYFVWGIHLMVIEWCEWKLKAIIARNTTFQGLK